MASQLHELVTNETLMNIFPNLNTASVERSFSQMMIKTRLRNCLGEKSLSHLKIAIESPENLSNSDLENIVDTILWYRKSRRMIV